MSGRQDHDPLAQYVERERTREMLLESVRPKKSGSLFSLLFVTAVIVGAVVGGYKFLNSPRGNDFFAKFKRGTASVRKEPEKPKDPEQAQARPAPREGDTDATADVARPQKPPTLGAQIMAFTGGKTAPAPNAAAPGVNAPSPTAAMPSAPEPPPARNPASSGNGIDGGDKDMQLAPSLDMVSDSGAAIAPTYRQLTHIPRVYLDEKKEFPEAP